MIDLATCRARGWVSALDVRFAESLGRLAAAGPLVQLGAALASRALARGDVGVDLRAVAADLSADDDDAWPDPATWAAALAACPDAVRGPDDDRAAPLVLDGTDLYLECTWALQERLGAIVRARLRAPHRPVDPARLQALLAQLAFDDPRAVLQKRAAVTATYRGFALVAGGPGTGKTATVVKLLALLQALETARLGRPLRVRLAAPTGKAAARMSESIRRDAKLRVPEALRDAVHVDASTIHRLLEWRGAGRFRFHRDNPLPVDLLIVDEASMVDLPLMTRLLDAVPEGARVLLLGDPDQLASVEIGSVFADLCRACTGPVSASLAAAWAATGCGQEGPTVPDPGPADALTTLQYTWRYEQGSGIEALARAVNRGAAAASLEVLHDPAFPDVTLRPIVGRHDVVRDQVVALATAPFTEVAAADSPTEALKRLRQLRVLGAVREGAWGVTALDALVAARVRAALGVPAGVDWYRGRPVMITRNDHDLKLYNGDVGVVWGEGDDDLQVWFETAEGPPRAVAPAMLPEHDTVFCTTVHKSQGSEYAHVVLVLPPGGSPVVTRELLYTGVTRAKARVTVVAGEEAWGEGVKGKVRRMSRVGERVG